MSKFNLIISVAVVATMVFFGVGIYQKANYIAAEGDSVSISYSIIDGDNTYDSQSASVVIGSNDNKIFTDELLLGAKYGSKLEFDTKLQEDVQIDDSTTIKKGQDVKIKGDLADIVPKAEEESETGSEQDSETDASSETDTSSETK